MKCFRKYSLNAKVMKLVLFCHVNLLNFTKHAGKRPKTLTLRNCFAIIAFVTNP